MLELLNQNHGLLASMERRDDTAQTEKCTQRTTWCDELDWFFGSFLNVFEGVSELHDSEPNSERNIRGGTGLYDFQNFMFVRDGNTCTGSAEFGESVFENLRRVRGARYCVSDSHGSMAILRGSRITSRQTQPWRCWMR